jgi:hypothetical protein
VEARSARYGLLPPVQGSSLVYEQLQLAHRYRNQLIALELCRREAYRKLRSENVDLSVHEQRAQNIADELKQVRQEISAERSATRRRVPCEVLAERATLLRKQLLEANTALKDARRAARGNERFRAATDALNERARAWAKALRATSGLYWGSYLHVEASVEDARKGGNRDPRFRSAPHRERISRTGIGPPEGTLGVQIQFGITVERLMSGEDTRLRITDAPDTWRRGRVSERGLRRCASKLLHIRVGSDGREPVWAVFPLILHRPLPPGALVKSAVVKLAVVGHAERWTASVLFTREREPQGQADRRAGVIALDLGWRKRAEGVRVAYWIDDRERHGEVLLGRQIRQRMHQASELQATEAQLFNRALRWLTRWLQVFSGAVPTFIAVKQPSLGAWRSSQRLRQLVFTWRDHRFEGDARIFELMERWMHQSRRLHQSITHARTRARLARREAYRATASLLARNYGTLVMERLDLKRVARLKQPEESKSPPLAQRQQLYMSAPGEFREVVEQAFRRENGAVVTLTSRNAGHHCHVCGCSCPSDEELWRTCEHCGARWDQDHNAAKNLMRLFCAAEPVAVLGPASGAGQRFGRGRRRSETEPPEAV